MQIIDSLGAWYTRKQLIQIENFKRNSEEVQQEGLLYLLKSAKKTLYGKKYDFDSINSIRQFQERVPVTSYEDLLPYINKMVKGEQNILWPSQINCFAKSSGTTSDKSKLIPVSTEGLREGHFQGGRDMLALYVQNYPNTKIFSGKNLSIGGSQESNYSSSNANLYVGNISAIVMKNLPFWAQYKRTPDIQTTLMDSWEEKVKKMAGITSSKDVTSMAGSPMWMMLLLQQIFNETKKNYIQEIWPNLEVFFHGSVSLLPYKPLFEQIDRDKTLRYQEVYNATEGFFGLQDRPNDPSLLLMLNYKIFYEFIPVEEFNSDNPKVLHLGEVELNKNYSMVISTNSGLWRYKIGDTIRFTELRPYRFLISGRTKHCINVFGEDLFVEHAEKALATACRETGAIIENYTAAPRYYESKAKGCHEWVVEFIKEPQNLGEFTRLLDRELCDLNDDYKAKRQKNAAIEMPVVHNLPSGTFYGWLKRNDKLGGQHKIPRLSNERTLVDELLKRKTVSPSI